MSPVYLGLKTKRDLLIVVNDSVVSANYTIVAQNREELLVPQNSSACGLIWSTPRRPAY